MKNWTVNSNVLNINHPPSSSKTQLDIWSKTGESFSYKFTEFQDLDNDTLTYDISQMDPEIKIKLAWIKLSQDGALSGIPSDQSLGTNAFYITVTDEFGSSTSLSIAINIDYPEISKLIENLKLAAGIGSILISVLAIIWKLDILHNILCKRRFRIYMTTEESEIKIIQFELIKQDLDKASALYKKW